MALPKIGNLAPLFSLPDQDGNLQSLKSLRGGIVVVYFYPKDDTPGCTIEAKEFRDNLAKFSKLGAIVLGVSPDDIASHCKFSGKYDLNFPLLADTDHTVAERYGLWVEKSMYGRKYWGVQRATFLIDGRGTVAKAWPKVSPEGHADEVLDAVSALK